MPLNSPSRVKTCTYCGRENEPATTFCTGCGKDLMEQERPDSSAGPVPELLKSWWLQSRENFQRERRDKVQRIVKKAPARRCACAGRMHAVSADYAVFSRRLLSFLVLRYRCSACGRVVGIPWLLFTYAALLLTFLVASAVLVLSEMKSSGHPPNLLSIGFFSALLLIIGSVLVLAIGQRLRYRAMK